MQRYFVDVENINIVEKTIIIKDKDFHHIKNVMRMKIGDKVFVCNNLGNTYLSTISKFADNCVILLIDEELNEKVELPVEVTIAQGIIRKEKTEEVIEKITELGASFYIPVKMERSIAKIGEKLEQKISRFNTISKEASEQSHRTKRLTVKSPISFSTLLNISNEYDLCLFAYEKSKDDSSNTIKKILHEFNKTKILVLIGPEGGISDNEAILLEKSGFKAVGLGPRILRTETAPSYIMSAISYEIEI